MTTLAETIVASGGDLANVFVYVKDGLGDRAFDVPKDTVVIDQKGCQYHPHILGVMTEQTIDIKNDDHDHPQHSPYAGLEPRVERIAAATLPLRSRRISRVKRSCCRCGATSTPG